MMMKWVWKHGKLSKSLDLPITELLQTFFALGSTNVYHQQKTLIHLFTAKDVQDSSERLGPDEVKKKQEQYWKICTTKAPLPKDFEEWNAFADKKNIACVSSFIAHVFFGQ